MEKISGILPATARITTVDLRNGGTARSGTPGFGRDVGVSTVAAKNAALETAAKANITHKNQMNIRNVEGDPKSEIVQRMADSFFINNAKRRELEDGIMLENNMEAKSSSQDESESSQPLGAVDSGASTDDSEDDNLVVGQYLDVRA